MTQRSLILTALLLAALPALSQQIVYGVRPSSSLAASAGAQGEASMKAAAAMDADVALLDDDPAYAKYKEGYNAILQENWNDARKRLQAVIDAYPTSEYRDDAEYWRSYALMHIDRKQAIEAYERFVKEYPKSTYYDDAVADLDRLNSGVYVITSPSSTATSVYVGPDGYGYGFRTDSGRYSGSSSGSSSRSSSSASSSSSSSSSSGSSARLTARQMRNLGHDMARLTTTLPRLAMMPRMPRMPRTPSAAMAAAAPLAPGVYALSGSAFGDDEKVDPETQLKLDALYAIGDAKEDEKSFQALKSIALDTHAHQKLRFAALDMVSGYEKYDVLSIYTEIARKDTSEEVQSWAVDYISNNAKDKNKSVQTLIDLYNGTPKSREEQKRRIFFAIAEVGNDRAVDFLSSVARTSDNYDMRREAVYYLGTMGSDKARTALYDILQGTKER